VRTALLLTALVGGCIRSGPGEPWPWTDAGAEDAPTPVDGSPRPDAPYDAPHTITALVASLCADPEAHVGETVRIDGPATPGLTTYLEASARGCTDGTCCNVTQYGPAFVCPPGSPQRAIWVRPAGGGTLGEYCCTTASIEGDPSPECPLAAYCEDIFARIAWLEGTLVIHPRRYEAPALTLEVSAHRMLAP
jgi:hypothetical protein